MLAPTKDTSNVMEHSPDTTNVRDLENASSTNMEENQLDLDHVRELEGYVLDARSGKASGWHLKTTKDGSTILMPQPSADPHDPLNWSQTKKNIILAVVSFTGIFPMFRALNLVKMLILSFAAFLPDYGSATGAVTLIPQAALVYPLLRLEIRFLYVWAYIHGVQYLGHVGR